VRCEGEKSVKSKKVCFQFLYYCIIFLFVAVAVVGCACS
jgi:hypothetical protein